MNAKILKEPLREPDVVLPEYLNIAQVSVWVSEKIFKIGNHCFDSVTSESLKLYSCKEPLVYLKAVADKSSRTSPRKKIATDFLEELDNILLGNYVGL